MHHNGLKKQNTQSILKKNIVQQNLVCLLAKKIQSSNVDLKDLKLLKTIIAQPNIDLSE